MAMPHGVYSRPRTASTALRRDPGATPVRPPARLRRRDRAFTTTHRTSRISWPSPGAPGQCADGARTGCARRAGARPGPGRASGHRPGPGRRAVEGMESLTPAPETTRDPARTDTVRTRTHTQRHGGARPDSTAERPGRGRGKDAAAGSGRTENVRIRPEKGSRWQSRTHPEAGPHPSRRSGPVDGGGLRGGVTVRPYSAPPDGPRAAPRAAVTGRLHSSLAPRSPPRPEEPVCPNQRPTAPGAGPAVPAPPPRARPGTLRPGPPPPPAPAAAPPPATPWANWCAGRPSAVCSSPSPLSDTDTRRATP